MGPAHLNVGHLNHSLKSMIYYSVVTFTTLGFGDIVPIMMFVMFNAFKWKRQFSGQRF